MDSLTHIVIGATIGDVQLGKSLGKRAMFLGAIAHSIPDLDFASVLWTDTASSLLAHRGFTHSILFLFLTTVTLAFFAKRYHRQHNVSYKTWILFIGLQIGVHLFIDLFNSYGMGLLEPFSHARVSFDALFVADPFFSVWPAISFAALFFLKRNSPKRIFWQRFALVAAVYLLYCSLNKIKIDNEIRQMLAKQQISHKGFFATPTPLNNWLWYTAVKTDSGFLIGHRSVFDRKKQMEFYYFPQNHFLLQSVSDQAEKQHLIRFSKGYYTIEKWSDTIVFNDLRFGQIVGWHNPAEKFVFHYYLGKGDQDNRLVVQRGRFAHWNRNTTRSLIERIGGN